MSLAEDQNRAARDNLLSQLGLIVGMGFFVLLLTTGHPLAAAATIMSALLGLYFFVDYLIVGHRLSRQEEK